MDENDESLVFVTFWDCRTHVPMTSSVERTDLDFKISVALICRSVTYILWSSDFASYLEDYLMEKSCTWDNGLTCKIYVGQ